MRWLNMLLWYAAAGFAGWYNRSHESSKLVLPFFPSSSRAEAELSGHLTVLSLLVIGTLFAVYPLLFKRWSRSASEAAD